MRPLVSSYFARVWPPIRRANLTADLRERFEKLGEDLLKAKIESRDATLGQAEHEQMVLWLRERRDIAERRDRNLRGSDFEPLHGEPFQTGAETVLGLLRKGVPDLAMQSRFYVAINEPDTIQRRPVLATLAHLADAACSAIKLFE